MTHKNFETVREFFDQNNLRYDVLEGKTRLITGFTSEHCDIRVHVNVDEEKSVVQVLSLVPINVPVHRRGAMAELLIRANDGLIVGNFDMSMKEGQVSYRASVCMADLAFPAAMMHPLIGLSMTTIGRYYPAIVGVAFRNESPSDAVASVEGSDGRDSQADRILEDMLDEPPKDFPADGDGGPWDEEAA